MKKKMRKKVWEARRGANGSQLIVIEAKRERAMK